MLIFHCSLQITPDEIGKICRRIFLYVMDHLEVSRDKDILPHRESLVCRFSSIFRTSWTTLQDSSNILILYLKFFQLLYGKYQETLLKEIENFLEGIVIAWKEQHTNVLSCRSLAIMRRTSCWISSCRCTHLRLIRLWRIGALGKYKVSNKIPLIY